MDDAIYIALVGPAGVELKDVQVSLVDVFRPYGFEVRTVKATDLFEELGPKPPSLIAEMEKGTSLRAKTFSADLLAQFCIAQIKRLREQTPRGRVVYVINQLKRPEESKLLRQIYGKAFWQIGVFDSLAHRSSQLRARHPQFTGSELEAEVARLIAKDQEDTDRNYGQAFRRTFVDSDFFLHFAKRIPQLQKWAEALFGKADTSPSADEYFMFAAFAAATRSCDLSRQVGAVVVGPNREVIATGTNEVPAPGGGTYWSDSRGRARDIENNHDANKKVLGDLFKSLANEVASELPTPTTDEGRNISALISTVVPAAAKKILGGLTEFGRSTHAEMEALLAAARMGVPVRGASLIVTTLPCHNCARHIIASGMTSVTFLEPYPKSRYMKLHDDAIHESEDHPRSEEFSNAISPNNGKVSFRPFFGCGPRRFLDLYSQKYGDGEPLIRENSDTGTALPFNPAEAVYRFSLFSSPVAAETTVSERFRGLVQKYVNENQTELREELGNFLRSLGVERNQPAAAAPAETRRGQG